MKTDCEGRPGQGQPGSWNTATDDRLGWAVKTAQLVPIQLPPQKRQRVGVLWPSAFYGSINGDLNKHKESCLVWFLGYCGTGRGKPVTFWGLLSHLHHLHGKAKKEFPFAASPVWPPSSCLHCSLSVTSKKSGINSSSSLFGGASFTRSLFTRTSRAPESTCWTQSRLTVRVL